MRTARIATVALLSGLVWLGTMGLGRLVTAQGRPAATNPDADAVKLISGYQKWTNAGAEPHFVPPRVSPGAAGPLPVPTQTADPHESGYTKIHVNATGAAEFLFKKRPQFPEGTVIVSEKRPSRETNAVPASLAVMVKRAAGFDRQHADWDYLAFNGEGTAVTARGRKTETCIECHEVQLPVDCVFRSYLNQDMRNQLK